MKHFIFRKLTILVILVCSLPALFVSCNKKDDDSSEVLKDETVASVAVSSFSLRANKNVMQNLDSVFFSIDLDRGIIYNADSLPKGTDISKLTVNIGFKETPETAQIEMTGGKKTGIVDYKANSSDTIDFTGRVMLTVTRGELRKTYNIKVNVHNTDPDQLIWSNMQSTRLPSRLVSPKAQKSVSAPDDNVICAIQESDNSYSLAVSRDLFNNKWITKGVTMPADVDLRSLNFVDDTMYALDASGHLFSSPFNPASDNFNLSWTDTGQVWSSLIGAYKNSVIGLSVQSGTLRHVHYPASSDITDSAADPEFPVSDFSNLALLSSKWASTPTAILVGGTKANGSVSDGVWAFDGTNWIKLASSNLVTLRGAALVPYYSYRKTSQIWVQTEFPAWLILGGKKADGSNNAKTMISYDNGLNWQQGGSLLTLPDFVPALANMDAVVMSTPENANLSDAWTRCRMPKRLSYEIDGYDISWKCPYIYLLGGYTSSNVINSTIWRGVLARLTFTPLI